MCECKCIRACIHGCTSVLVYKCDPPILRKITPNTEVGWNPTCIRMLPLCLYYTSHPTYVRILTHCWTYTHSLSLSNAPRTPLPATLVLALCWSTWTKPAQPNTELQQSQMVRATHVCYPPQQLAFARIPHLESYIYIYMYIYIYTYTYM